MRGPVHKSQFIRRVAILLAVTCIFASAALLSRAQTQSGTLTIVNNSSVEIRHVYLSHADQEDWSGDQMDSSVISPGASFTLSGVECPGASYKVIGEDQNGCFFSGIVACSDNAVWTITNDATPNCGN